MLPGFRILLALVVLSFAILIFGFGALALLRTAHQNLASQPTWQPAWRTPVEIASTQHNDREQITNGTQTLALLRVDPPAPRPHSGMEGLGVAPAPATDAPPALSAVQEHGDEAPDNVATQVKSSQSAETSAVAAAIRNDRPIAAAGSDPVADAGDKTSAQTTTAPPADEAPKSTASNASAAPEAPQGASLPGQVATSEPIAPDPDATAPAAKAAEAASETAKADPAALNSELPIKLAALPDATTSSAEAGPQAGQQLSARKADAAELRAKRRARARQRARRLALARARAAQLAQQQQATATSPFYGSNVSTTQNATSAANATPFGAP